MHKIQVTNISSVGIIFREANPAELFIELKDDGHPMKLVRRQLCPIGGNWIGENAKKDTDTFETYKRELREELSFERPMRNSVELDLLGLADTKTFAPVYRQDVEVCEEDKVLLANIKNLILWDAEPWGDFLNHIPRSALNAADPENKRDGFTTLTSYYTTGLAEGAWGILCHLQDKYKNLSNESVTMVTTIDEIVRAKTHTAFAHDRVLSGFFQFKGVRSAERMPLVPGLSSIKMGMPLATYADYLNKYDVAKKPV